MPRGRDVGPFGPAKRRTCSSSFCVGVCARTETNENEKRDGGRFSGFVPVFRKERPDPPTQDDINITITWYDGGGPYQVLHAWNGVKWTPLAVVMSGSMFCMAHRYTFFKEKRGFSLCITRRPKHNLERSGAHPRIDNWNSEGSREYKIQHVER